MTAIPECDAQRELSEAWRAVANAKLIEYRRQAWRLAHLVRQGALDKQLAVDRLWEIAIAHTLVRALGEDRVEAMISDAFARLHLSSHEDGGCMSWQDPGWRWAAQDYVSERTAGTAGGAS